MAVLLIDEKNSHEYFGHKYNVSNNLKDKLNLLAKNFRLLKENKDFFNTDLEKNIYLNDKNHLIMLNILNFVINTKYKFKRFFRKFKKNIKSKTYKFNIDGEYLIENGMSKDARWEKF